MPRKSEKIKLSEKQDRRRKLTTEQKKRNYRIIFYGIVFS